jgi:hypothetical protein
LGVQETRPTTTETTYLAIPIPDRRSAAMTFAALAAVLLVAAVPFLIFPIKVRLISDTDRH